MPKLIVKNFSVIKDAELEFGKLTVLIGPQSSGKSLLCKLRFFLLDALSIATRAIGDQETLKAFRADLKKKFIAEFPENTWGSEKFQISYTHNHYEVSLRQVGTSDPEEGSLQVSLSGEFEELYQSTLQAVRSILQKRKSEDQAEVSEAFFEALDVASHSLRSLLGEGEREIQLFIPAGRAFFTNYSKSFTAIQSRRTDPFTGRFGQLMARAFDRHPRITGGNRKELPTFDSNTFELLKGRLERGEGLVMFKTEDGRTLSLSQLSSGTQEVLPLVLALRPLTGSVLSRTVYVEEPEAHLFPTAQYELVKLFSWLSNIGPELTRWVFTTHSPYILSSFNNLILAGQLGENETLRREIPIKQEYWIKRGAFAAYCIHDGILRPILSESGLIDGEYLDSVSETIGNEFDSLLKLENEHIDAT